MIKLLEFGILPIFVVDGDSLPDKLIRIKERHGKTDKARQKLIELRTSIATMHRLEISPAITKQLRTAANGTVYVSNEDIAAVLNIFGAIGLPVLRAKNDAERLCASLCIEGLAAAVCSNDTDCYAFGSPRVITEFGSNYFNAQTNRPDRFVNMVQTSDILTESGLTLEELVDLCIMLGCDFNERIKGTGVKRCIPLIKHHRRLESIAQIKDVSCLNYRRCREIFAYQPACQLVHGPDLTAEELYQRLQINPTNLYQYGNAVLAQYGLESHLTNLIQCFNQLPPIKNAEFELPSRKIKLRIMSAIACQPAIAPMPMTDPAGTITVSATAAAYSGMSTMLQTAMSALTLDTHTYYPLHPSEPPPSNYL